MTVDLAGDCEDCGEFTTALRYKPSVPFDDQARPTICARCKEDREERARQQRPVPPQVPPTPMEDPDQ